MLRRATTLFHAARSVDGEFADAVGATLDLQLLEITQLKDNSGASDSYLR